MDITKQPARETPIGMTLAKRRAMVDKPALLSRLVSDLAILRYEEKRALKLDAELQTDALMSRAAGAWARRALPEPPSDGYEPTAPVFLGFCAILWGAALGILFSEYMGWLS